MGAFLFYLLKSGCCLVVFYIFFKLLMSRSTFFRFNRIKMCIRDRLEGVRCSGRPTSCPDQLCHALHEMGY